MRNSGGGISNLVADNSVDVFWFSIAIAWLTAHDNMLLRSSASCLFGLLFVRSRQRQLRMNVQ